MIKSENNELQNKKIKLEFDTSEKTKLNEGILNDNSDKEFASLEEIELNFESRRVYNFTSEGEITDILVGAFLAKPTFQQLAVSTSSGKVLILVDGKIKGLLNPKTGPILSLAAGPLTRFGKIDLAAGDNLGQITVFSGTQVVAKASTSHPIQSLAFTYDIVGNVHIVSGSSLGHLSCHHFHTRLWRTALSFDPSIEISTNQTNPSSSPITEIRTACIRDNYTGAIAAYTFVINNSKFVHVYSSSKLVTVVPFPTVIVSLCKGNFSIDTIRTMLNVVSYDILFASQGGEVYYLDALFKPVLYTKLCHSISQILPYCPKNLPHNSSNLLVARGISNKVYFYLGKTQIHVLDLPDWITKVATGDLLNSYNFSQYQSSTKAQSKEPQSLLSESTLFKETNSFCQPMEDFLGPDIAFALDDSSVIVLSGSISQFK